MYLLSRKVTLEWELLKTDSVPALEDLDLIFINPLGEEQYIESPILTGNYIPPTATTNGTATSEFTPELEGFWRIRLVLGSSSSYKILSKMEMYVFDSTTTTSPFSEDIGKPAPYDINYFLQGYAVAGETYGSFAASRSISLDTDVPGSVALCDTVGLATATEFNIVKNGTQIGNVVFEPNSYVGTITCTAGMLNVGDKLQIKVSSAVDSQIKDVAINIVGCCTIVPCTVF